MIIIGNSTQETQHSLKSTQATCAITSNEDLLIYYLVKRHRNECHLNKASASSCNVQLIGGTLKAGFLQKTTGFSPLFYLNVYAFLKSKLFLLTKKRFCYGYPNYASALPLAALFQRLEYVFSRILS